MAVDAVLIAGPTTSGKSALALALAEEIGGAVINADSMQVYTETRILTARPTDEDTSRAPHLLYGHVSVNETYSAGRYQAEAAHALRTPLTAIRGSLEVMQRGADAGTAGALAPTLEAIEDLTALVNRLLLLERLESRRTPVSDTQRVALDRVAADLVDTLGVVAADRGVSLESVVEPVAVRGDLAQLRSALANLIDNALRHTPPGGKVEVRQ